MAQNPRRESKKASVRAAVWDVSAGYCYHCGDQLHPFRFHVDHLDPICAGGADAIENMVASCPSCNQRKSITSDREKRIATPILGGMTGDELRERRERLDLTQTQLARRLDVYQTTISQWERGERNIRHGRILALALWALAHGAGEEGGDEREG